MRFRLFFLTVFFLLNISISFAQQTKILHTCDTNSENKIVCDFRFGNPWDAQGSPEKVEVEWPDGHREVVDFQAYNPNENTTTWLLLFDRSKSLGKESMQIIQDDFSRIISGLRSKENIGIATFAENFRLLSPIGAERGRHIDVLENLKPVGNKTFLYQSAIDALNELERHDADRKALVIISDGKSEDNRFSFRDVINRANELNIVVYGVGYSETRENDVYLNELVEIARSTQGPHQRAQLYDKETRVLEPQMMQYFLDYMQNGGYVTFSHRMHERGDVSVKLIATMEDGRPFATKVKLPNVFIQEEKTFWDVLKDNEVIAIIVLASTLMLLLLIFLIIMLRRDAKRRQAQYIQPDPSLTQPRGESTEADGITIDAVPEDEDDGNKRTHLISDQSNKGEVYGYLEHLGSNSERIALKSTALSIGRHIDNEIRFSGSTVHRRHASLHMSSEQSYVITDLGGEKGNGTFVNGHRISKVELKNGDLIRLGDVELRFLDRSNLAA